jgi:site-specific DNA recombinase
VSALLSKLDAFIYLRKSRKDLEEEKRQAELGNHYDTLERHRDQLLEFAKIKEIRIVDIIEEIESGEFISERPKMQQMLREIENRAVDAVLCMDLDRLGRGDMVDQGTIYRIFKNSETIIVTPTEIIDPQDENQELTFSIKSLIAREELKSIVKRMQRGRRQSAKEGKSISKKAPFGYLRDENLKLYPDPEIKWVVEMMFQMAANGAGRRAIAEELDRVQIKPPTKDNWDPSTVLAILKNEAYIGWIVWGKIKYTKINGKYTRKKIDSDGWIIHKNAHEPIVSEKLFYKAIEAIKGRYRPHTKKGHSLSNPLAGLLYCENCGKAMVMQPRSNRPNHAIRCFSHQCKGVQKGSSFNLVEERILSTLEQIIDQFELPEKLQKKINSTIKSKEKALVSLAKDKKEVEDQKNNLHDLLEKKIYNIETFLQRVQILKEKLEVIDLKIAEIENEINHEKQQQLSHSTFIPRVKNVLEAYHSTQEAEKKNRLMKTVIEKATYLRKKDWIQSDQFEIKLYTKI